MKKIFVIISLSILLLSCGQKKETVQEQTLDKKNNPEIQTWVVEDIQKNKEEVSKEIKQEEKNMQEKKEETKQEEIKQEETKNSDIENKVKTQIENVEQKVESKKEETEAKTSKDLEKEQKEEEAVFNELMKLIDDSNSDIDTIEKNITSSSK